MTTPFNSRYGFAVGLIRVLEKRFFSKALLDRLLFSTSLGEAGRILSETGYGSEFADLKDVKQAEKLLEQKWDETLTLISKLTWESYWIDLFRKRIDYHNLKVLFKSKLTEKIDSDFLREGGFIPIDTLEKEVHSGKKESSFPFLDRAIKKVKAILSDSVAPYRIDLVLEKLEQEEWELVFEEHPNSFLQEWRSLEVDLFNLGLFLRIKYLNQDATFLDDGFIHGGTFERIFLLRLLEEPWETVYKELRRTGYSEIISSSVRDLEDGWGFVSWERMCQEMKWRMLQPVKLYAFGVEVLFAYLFFKEIELSVVRKILVGNANGLKGEIIKKGVPDVFF